VANDNVSNWYTSMFRAQVHQDASQTMSRLEYITEKIPDSKAETGYYDSVGSVKSRLVTTRYAQVQFAGTDHKRRKLTKQEFAIEIPVAERDIESVLADPKSVYIKRAVQEMQRRKDRVIIEAAFADVQTGTNGATTVNFAGDGGLTVNATGGVTHAKINEINQNFIDNEVGNENTVRKALGITGAEHTAIMAINEFTSRDYVANQPVVGGAIETISGLDLIRYGNLVDDPLLLGVGGTRTSFAIADGGIALWTPREVNVVVEKRTDLLGTWQIIVTMVLAAVRTEGALVQKFTTSG